MKNLQETIDEARDIVESLDDNVASMTVGFNNPTYVLSKQELQKIAKALYLMDCKLNDEKPNHIKHESMYGC